MSNQSDAKEAVTGAAAERPLRGGKPIARVFWASSRKAVRRLYNEMDRLPVFQVTPRGVLYAFESRLLKHLEMLSDAKEQEIAKATMGALPTPPALALKARQPARSLHKMPAREAAAPHPPRDAVVNKSRNKQENVTA